MLTGIKQKNKALFPSTCSVIDPLFESLSQKSVGISPSNSQDAGGITYMTNNLHEMVAAGGLVAVLAAFLSITVSQKYIEENLIPEITPDDVDSYLNIIFQAIEFMSGDSQSLAQYIKRKDQFDVNMLGDLVQS